MWYAYDTLLNKLYFLDNVSSKMNVSMYCGSANEYVAHSHLTYVIIISR